MLHIVLNTQHKRKSYTLCCKISMNPSRQCTACQQYS